MQSKKINDTTWVLRLLKGEEILTEVKAFCQRENIRLGYLTGLGAMEEVEVGAFLHDQKKYETRVFKGSIEIVSLIISITTLDGEIYLHPHIGIADEQSNMYGGHLYHAIVNPTCEIFLHAFDGEVSRYRNELSGLNELNLS